MIRLINGRGQLGTALKKIIEKKRLSTESDTVIYHTWDILDKSKDVQKKCYEQFKDFVDGNKSSRMIFISTYSEKENWYNHFKQKAETYLTTKNSEGYVLRLPTLIGKGVCDGFREDTLEPFGEMELLSLEEAAQNILEFIEYKGLIRNFRIRGYTAPAVLIKQLILFGREGNKR